MLRFKSTGMDGKTTLWVGLTQENLERLPTDPIMFDVEPSHRDPDRVVLISAPTHQALQERLRALGLPVPVMPEPTREDPLQLHRPPSSN
jgi:hypothetical protein